MERNGKGWIRTNTKLYFSVLWMLKYNELDLMSVWDSAKMFLDLNLTRMIKSTFSMHIICLGGIVVVCYPI